MDKLSAIPKYWWLLFAIFIVHQLVEKIGDFHIAIFDNFLDPFLSMPLILGIHLFERRILFEKNNSYVLPVFEILVITIFFGFVFEWIFPRYFEGFYADPLDLLMYVLGSVFFHFAMNNSKEAKSKISKLEY